MSEIIMFFCTGEIINQKGRRVLKNSRGIYRPILIITLALLQLVMLCGCAHQKPEDSGISSRPKMIIGCDNYEPYNYISGTGGFTGMDVDIAREALSRMGYEPVFKQIIWENKDDYLEDGSIDCLWGCFTMTGREDRYQWTCPYLYSRQMVVVRADSSISRLSELRNKRIAVQATSKPEEIFLEGSNKHIPKPEMVYSFSTMDEVYACLRKGYADAICGHESALDSLIRTSPADYRKLRESVYKSEIGVAFSKDFNSGIVDRLSETLTEMKNDGTIADIAEKYSMDKDVLPEVTDK